MSLLPHRYGMPYDHPACPHDEPMIISDPINVSGPMSTDEMEEIAESMLNTIEEKENKTLTLLENKLTELSEDEFAILVRKEISRRAAIEVIPKILNEKEYNTEQVCSGTFLIESLDEEIDKILAKIVDI